MKIISLMNKKGGVAKTTTAISLAYQLALKKNVLLIDADPQGNASNQFNIINPETTIRDALLGKNYAVIEIHKRLDVLPANEDLEGIDAILINEISREFKLKKALKKLTKEYDYIIIDCPTNASFLTINALACSNYVIIPINADAFSLAGISKMIEFTQVIKDNLNEDLDILGVLITRYDKRLKLSKKIVKEIEQEYYFSVVFDTKIREVAAIRSCQDISTSIFEYNKNSNGAIDYINFTKEVLKRING